MVFKTDYPLLQVKSDSAILSSFIKLSFVIKIIVLSIFEWPLKTCFTVYTGRFECYIVPNPEDRFLTTGPIVNHQSAIIVNN